MSGPAGGHVRARPDLPWRLRLWFAIITTISDACLRRDGTVNRRLLSFLDLKISPSDKPSNGVTTSDTTVDPSRNLWFRLFLPVEAASAGENLPVIVYFHGGGFVFLSANSKPMDDFCRRLARELPAAIVSVDYRLAPEHRCPSQYNDGFDVLKFIDKNPPLHSDLTRCFIAGDSAGGNLAHHVTARASEFKFRNLKILGLIPIQPYFGGEERTEAEIQLTGSPIVSVWRTDWCWKAFLPEGSDRDHPAANVFGPKSGDISGVKFPKSLVFIGGFDPLKDWQKSYCEGMKKNGKRVKMIEYPNAIHSFYAIPQLPESCLFIKEIWIVLLVTLRGEGASTNSTVNGPRCSHTTKDDDILQKAVLKRCSRNALPMTKLVKREGEMF